MIGLGASNAIDSIRWTSYGGNVAIGHGRFPSNDCNSGCAGGTITYLPATVKLRYRSLCRGKLVYQQMAITVPGNGVVRGEWDAVSAMIGAARDAC